MTNKPENFTVLTDKPPFAPVAVFGNVEGYEKLLNVLARAFNQASSGKGHERHANGEPFHEQVMADGAKRFGHGALLFQAYKKSE